MFCYMFQTHFLVPIDHREYVGALFLGLAKTFDCVDLSQKLACYGCSDI